jgi:hypothetical protein
VNIHVVLPANITFSDASPLSKAGIKSKKGASRITSPWLRMKIWHVKENKTKFVKHFLKKIEKNRKLKNKNNPIFFYAGALEQVKKNDINSVVIEKRRKILTSFDYF